MPSINTEIIRRMIKSLLNQCYKLDLYGIDHGELSDLRKHVIINQRVNIIDFDSSSTNRKTSNLTSCIQYLFIGGPQSKTFQTLFDIDIDNMILLLRQYKLNKNYVWLEQLQTEFGVSASPPECCKTAKCQLNCSSQASTSMAELVSS